MHLRAGAALLEALVAGVLLTIVATTGATLIRAQSRIARDVTLRSERNDAVRSAVLTLQAELQNVDARVDLLSVGRDSIAARIFRGSAVVCGHRDGMTLVRYRGLRLPDVTKDSMLQVGIENAAAIQRISAIPGACDITAGEQALGLAVGSRARLNTMWLLFETGSYHLHDYALRYRRGAESRQPVTNEIIDVRRSGFAATADTIVRAINVALADRRTSAHWRSTIALRNAR